MPPGKPQLGIYLRAIDFVLFERYGFIYLFSTWIAECLHPDDLFTSPFFPSVTYNAISIVYHIYIHMQATGLFTWFKKI